MVTKKLALLLALVTVGCGDPKDSDMPDCAPTARQIICPVGSPTQHACIGIASACQLPDGNVCAPACQR